MDTKQIPDDVVRILVPADAVSVDPDDIDRDEIIDHARDQLAEQLSGLADEDGPIEDPGLAALALATNQVRSAERSRRLLIAYLREFANGYSMETVGAYAGMSASNVRKGNAYNDDDIATVTQRIGRARPGPPADPELAAMAAIEAMDPTKRHYIVRNLDNLNLFLRTHFPDVHNNEGARNRVTAWARDKYATTEEN